MAKLEQGGGDFDYPKFKEVGDRVTGTFVSFSPDIKGKFGKESVLILKHESRSLSVRCPATLAGALKQNEQLLVDGALIDIVYTGTKPSKNFPQPMKLFDIDVTPPGGGETTSSSSKDAEEIPF